MLELLAAGATAPIQWADLGLKEGIDLGFFTLRYYSLAYLAGIVLGYVHLLKMIKQPGAPMAKVHAEDLFFYCTLGIILGGRLGYATFYQPALFTTWNSEETIPWALLRLWDGGMSFHGGLIGVVLAIIWVSRRNDLKFLRVCDYIAVCVPFGMLFGRLANFVNGELWGKPAGPDVPWAMVFPDGGPIARHPSQLYQAGMEGLLLMLAMLGLFWLTRARFRPALLVGAFTAGMGAARFVGEIFRQPDAQLTEFAERSGLSMGQWLSLPLIVIGLGLIVWALRRPPLASGAGRALKEPAAA